MVKEDLFIQSKVVRIYGFSELRSDICILISNGDLIFFKLEKQLLEA